MAKIVSASDAYSEDETARRRDAVIKRMANTPPKPRPKRERPKQKTTKKQNGR